MTPETSSHPSAPGRSVVPARPRSRRFARGGLVALLARAPARLLPFAIAAGGAALLIGDATREAALRLLRERQAAEVAAFIGLIAAGIVGLRLAFACRSRAGWQAAGLFHAALSAAVLILALELVGWGRSLLSPALSHAVEIRAVEAHAEGTYVEGTYAEGAHVDETLASEAPRASQATPGGFALAALGAAGCGLLLAALALFRPLRKVSLAPQALGWCLAAAALAALDLAPPALLGLDPAALASSPFSRIAALALAAAGAIHFGRKLDAARQDWLRESWRAAGPRVTAARRRELEARHDFGPAPEGAPYLMSLAA